MFDLPLGFEVFAIPLAFPLLHSCLFPFAAVLDCWTDQYRLYDIGGQASFRDVWANYFPDIDGILFVIDSSASERYGEAVKELRAILANPDNVDLPICILANKQDLPDAVSATEFEETFQLEDFIGREHTYVVIDSVIGGDDAYFGWDRVLGWFTEVFKIDPRSQRRLKFRRQHEAERAK